jgi:histidinol-phosphate aminotransferase
VLQTLSKAFGLAGARIGMAIGQPEVIQLMNNVKAPYNVNKLTAHVAMEALSDLELYKEHKQQILKARSELIANLQTLPFVKKIHHTDANFVLFQVSDSVFQGCTCAY